MRITALRLATRRNVNGPPRIEILPPLPLYRRILRAHRLLPARQRALGDSYVKNEFRLHRNIDNPAQIIGFLSSWQKYLEAILGDKWQHEKLDMDAIERMDSDKIVQLYELMVAAQNRESIYNAIPDVELPRPKGM